MATNRKTLGKADIDARRGAAVGSGEQAKRGVTMNSRTWLFVVLAVLFTGGLVGAVVTYLLLSQFIERKKKIESKKADLILKLGSSVKDVAAAAAGRLSRRGWLLDGSVRGASLKKANLERARLEKADLQETILRWALLRGANLEGAKLQRARLEGAELEGADLQEAYLEEADLRWANLQRANLQGAYLQGANLQEANLQKANLHGADLYGADLTKAILPDRTRWMPDTDMARFTDPEHPDFWRSDDPHSPAYPGQVSNE